MKKLLTYIMAGITLLLFARCNSLDLEPTSSIADVNYWKNETQFSAFNVGLHGLLRECSYNIFILGEPRADIFSGTTAFGSVSQGKEHMWQNTLSKNNPSVSNFAGMYKVINQINLMIAKCNNTDVLPEASKSYYLGEAYGMRAYLYFHLIRSWGDVVLQTEFTDGGKIDLGNLNKAASPASEVMAQITNDITLSENAFGTDASYKYGKHYWSKAATLMLKAEVYLWKGKQMAGGTNDYTTAKNALLDIQKIGFTLQNNFSDVFSYDNKKNSEIIFTIHFGKDECFLWVDNNYSTMLPQYSNLSNSFDENGTPWKDIPDGNVNGVNQYPINKDIYHKAFRSEDTRKRGSLQGAFTKDENGSLVYQGTYSRKFLGTLLSGAASRSMLDDYPIYRYADCILLLAEAKVLLGEDPTNEINLVRERAYGKAFFDTNRATLAYPNDNGDFYTDNALMKADSSGALETILKERLREFLFEGKRWYDLRRMGTEYVTEYTSAVPERLLWPIDISTITNNPLLTQPSGYDK